VVGHNIRILRLERRMSQGDLAERIGVTFQQVQKYEKGANRVSAGRLARIADALDVPVAFFYRSAAPAERHAETGFAYLKSKKALRLARAYAAIPHAPARNVLVALAELLERKPRAG
jgi:transcriptional regulator with XRE-family HTH domain